MRTEGAGSFSGHCLHFPFKESQASDVACYLQPTREKSTQWWWELPLAALGHTTTWSITFKQFRTAPVMTHDITMAAHKSLVQLSGVEDNSSSMVSGPCWSGNMSSRCYFESRPKTTMRGLRCFTTRSTTGALESDRDGMAKKLTVTSRCLITLVPFGKFKCYFQHGNYDMKSQCVTVNSDTFVN